MDREIIILSRRLFKAGAANGKSRGVDASDPPIRSDLVARVRAQIQAGGYDSSAKIEAATDRLAAALDLVV